MGFSSSTLSIHTKGACLASSSTIWNKYTTFFWSKHMRDLKVGSFSLFCWTIIWKKCTHRIFFVCWDNRIKIHKKNVLLYKLKDFRCLFVFCTCNWQWEIGLHCHLNPKHLSRCFKFQVPLKTVNSGYTEKSHWNNVRNQHGKTTTTSPLTPPHRTQTPQQHTTTTTAAATTTTTTFLDFLVEETTISMHTI